MEIDADTLVIGASAAGLAVARSLEAAGLGVTVIDAEAQIGMPWRNAYDRLHLHTPRNRSGLPHHPMPASYPNYPTRQQVVDYLDDYARGLTHSPLLGRRALSVRPEQGRWVTTTSDETFTSRNVVVATGNTRVPFVPTFPGVGEFLGQVLHTSLYKNGTAYRGQRVLVVGFGNSAAEIAIDLHEHGALPTLSVRGPVNVLPRDVFGIPVVNLGLIQRVFPPRIADIISAPLMRLILGDLSKLGLQRPALGPAAQIAEQHQIPVLDIGTIGLIRAGKIALRPGIERFTASGVVFADGRQDEFAAVILGTGYRAQLQELLAGVAGVLDSEGTPLTSGSRTAAAGLYFCGFTVAAGGQLREIGIEAGRIAGLIKAAPQR